MSQLHPVVSIRIHRNEKCFGPGVAELLRRVQQTQSLRGASMAMGMAYSKAWTVMRRSEQELGFPLLVYSTGGKHGGGAVLTLEGEKLLDAYEQYAEKVRADAEAHFLETFREFL